MLIEGGLVGIPSLSAISHARLAPGTLIIEAAARSRARTKDKEEMGHSAGRALNAIFAGNRQCSQGRAQILAPLLNYRGGCGRYLFLGSAQAYPLESFRPCQPPLAAPLIRCARARLPAAGPARQGLPPLRIYYYLSGACAHLGRPYTLLAPVPFWIVPALVTRLGDISRRGSGGFWETPTSKIG